MPSTPNADLLLNLVKDFLQKHNLSKSILMPEERSIKVMPQGVNVDRVIITLDANMLSHSFLRLLITYLTPNVPEAFEFLDEHILNAISPSEVFIVGCDGKDIEYYVEHEGGQLRSYDTGKRTPGIYNHVPRVYYPATYQQLAVHLGGPTFSALKRVIPLHELAHVFERHHPELVYACHMSTTKCPSLSSVNVQEGLMQLAIASNPASAAAMQEFIRYHESDVLAWLSIGIRHSGGFVMNVYVRPSTWLQNLMRVLGKQ